MSRQSRISTRLRYELLDIGTQIYGRDIGPFDDRDHDLSWESRSSVFGGRIALSDAVIEEGSNGMPQVFAATFAFDDNEIQIERYRRALLGLDFDKAIVTAFRRYRDVYIPLQVMAPETTTLPQACPQFVEIATA